MGKKELKLQKAADLILIDDDLSKMVVAVAAGRHIYTNLKKSCTIYCFHTHSHYPYGFSTLIFWLGLSEYFLRLYMSFF
jgi:magnesium-transporting ATPase (P-type)